MRPSLAVLLALPLLVAACAPRPPARVEAYVAPPVRVVLFIGDGMGRGSLEAARRAAPLHMETAPVATTIDTRSANDRVTDSAAAATALATGTRTYNGAIGVDLDTVALRTVVEDADACGLSTGLVATSSVTHATPASFAAHVASRTEEQEIARQLAASPVDVLLGGGSAFFAGATRDDGVDLLDSFSARGCEVLPDLAALDAASADCVVGLFAPEGMAQAPARGDALARMTTAAIRLLARDPDGFFLMVEGSQIDWAQHDNDGPRAVAEMIDFDRAIAAARAELAHLPNALVVVTADHETGGMSVRSGRSAETDIRFRGTGHTGARVPLFAFGPAAPLFADVERNDEVGALLRRIVCTR